MDTTRCSSTASVQAENPAVARRVEEAFLLRAARIIGPQSAAADALREMEKRRSQGDADVHCIQYRYSFYVGSTKAAPQPERVSPGDTPNTDAPRQNTAEGE